MKFARYLEETQIPEWKKAYIDYRGLKKRITAIRKEQESEEGDTPLLQPASPVVDNHEVTTRSSQANDVTNSNESTPENDKEEDPSLTLPKLNLQPVKPPSPGEENELSPPQASSSVPDNLREHHNETYAQAKGKILSPEPEHQVSQGTMLFTASPSVYTSPPPIHQDLDEEGSTHSQAIASTRSTSHAHFSPDVGRGPHGTGDAGEGEGRPHIPRSTTFNMGFLPRLRRSSTWRTGGWQPGTNRKGSGLSRADWERHTLARSIPLKDLIPLLSPTQKAFFEKLDRELDKVESFYVVRESEMRTRVNALKAQLAELKDHRKLFYEAQKSQNSISWLTSLPGMSRRRQMTQGTIEGPATTDTPPGGSPRSHHGSIHGGAGSGGRSTPHIPTQNKARKRRRFKADRDGDESRDKNLDRRIGVVDDTRALEESIENMSPTTSTPGHVSPLIAHINANLYPNSSATATPAQAGPSLSRATTRYSKASDLGGLSSGGEESEAGAKPEEEDSSEGTKRPGILLGGAGGKKWKGLRDSLTLHVSHSFLRQPLSKPSSHANLKADAPESPTVGGSGSGSGEEGKKREKGKDPEEYQQAKKKLKKAVLECYRGLEVLNNYRTLNVIGFRKALKKFEKISRIPAQQAYILEKVEPCAFASSVPLGIMLREMEGLYAARFTKGDKKVALSKLRGGAQHKSHHFSTFRTGMMLGMAIPAVAHGLYLSFQPETRAAIPSYDGLLFLYGVFLVPVLFSLLVGVNVLVWSRVRINYVFIFELELRSKLDHREYFELPSMMLCTLAYAFWLSFARIGAPRLDPTYWALVWLGLAVVTMANPIKIMARQARWWLGREVGRLLTSGVHHVEFADFWMGDQFCSLIFTLSNLYYVGCVYASGFHASPPASPASSPTLLSSLISSPGDVFAGISPPLADMSSPSSDWQRCTGTKHWGVPFVLAMLPLLVRLIQSVRRWVDSGLVTHLINGGKYGTGILYYLFYFSWRHHGGYGGSFVVWCIFGVLYAVYAGAWDLLMDWSLLRPHAPYRFLRPELLYTNYIPMYYFAIVSNILIRFIWVLYIPKRGPSFPLRTFIAGMLEMLRRIQWNIYRLENEHLGNMDQYRATREVPLPYTFDDQGHDSEGEGDEDDEAERRSIASWGRRRRMSISSGNVPNVNLGSGSGVVVGKSVSGAASMSANRYRSVESGVRR